MHAEQPRDLRRRQGGRPILRLVDVERLGHERASSGRSPASALRSATITRQLRQFRQLRRIYD